MTIPAGNEVAKVSGDVAARFPAAVEAAARAHFDSVEAVRGMPPIGDTSWASVRSKAHGSWRAAETILGTALPHLPVLPENDPATGKPWDTGLIRGTARAIGDEWTRIRLSMLADLIEASRA